MNDDDTDLTRLFAEQPEPQSDESFVRRVASRVTWRQRWLLVAPLVAVLVIAFGVWATWPAARDMGLLGLVAVELTAGNVALFFNTPLGMATGLVLLAGGAFWYWLYERVRPRA